MSEKPRRYPIQPAEMAEPNTRYHRWAVYQQVPGENPLLVKERGEPLGVVTGGPDHREQVERVAQEHGLSFEEVYEVLWFDEPTEESREAGERKFIASTSYEEAQEIPEGAWDCEEGTEQG